VTDYIARPMRQENLRTGEFVFLSLQHDRTVPNMAMLSDIKYRHLLLWIECLLVESTMNMIEYDRNLFRCAYVSTIRRAEAGADYCSQPRRIPSELRRR
jgi:hypothetical protein